MICSFPYFCPYEIITREIKLIGFLKKQEANGKFFSKAMQKETHTDMEEV